LRGSNKGLELTASSARSAPASGNSSVLVLGRPQPYPYGIQKVPCRTKDGTSLDQEIDMHILERNVVDLEAQCPSWDTSPHRYSRKEIPHGMS